MEFNWPMLMPKNIEDKPILIEFLTKNGFNHTEELAENGCPLIKVTGPYVECLATRILDELYPKFRNVVCSYK